MCIARQVVDFYHGEAGTVYVQLVSTTSAAELWVDLPIYVGSRFEHSPLVLVAAQINYEEVATEIKHPQAREVQKALGSRWTALQAAPIVQTTMTPAGAVNSPQRGAYRLSTSDSKWALAVNPDNFVLETNAYTRWADMAAQLELATQAIADVFDPASRLRVGLRYVDQIQLPEGYGSWQGLIPSSLLGLGADPRFAPGVLGSEKRYLLQLDAGAQCLFRHGLMADGKKTPGRTYLLDFDVFNDQPTMFDAEAIQVVLQSLHAHAGALFEASIEPELRNQLRG